MYFLPMFAIFVQDSFSNLAADVKVKIARDLDSQSQGHLQQTNHQNAAIVTRARLEEIHSDYRQLIETTNITAHQIKDSFVWSPMMEDERMPFEGDTEWISQSLSTLERDIEAHPAVLGRGSFVDDLETKLSAEGLSEGRYLMIKVVDPITGTPATMW